MGSVGVATPWAQLRLFRRRAGAPRVRVLHAFAPRTCVAAQRSRETLLGIRLVALGFGLSSGARSRVDAKQRLNPAHVWLPQLAESIRKLDARARLTAHSCTPIVFKHDHGSRGPCRYHRENGCSWSMMTRKC